MFHSSKDLFKFVFSFIATDEICHKFLGVGFSATNLSQSKKLKRFTKLENCHKLPTYRIVDKQQSC